MEYRAQTDVREIGSILGMRFERNKILFGEKIKTGKRRAQVGNPFDMFLWIFLPHGMKDLFGYDYLPGVS